MKILMKLVFGFITVTGLTVAILGMIANSIGKAEDDGYFWE
jgi:hypothetical protein